MQLYVVRMLRFGDPERHSYNIGVYTSEHHARLAGTCEVTWRGGKYEYQLEKFELDSTIPKEIWENHNGLYTEN